MEDDKRKFNGGKRKGAGRPSKAEETTLIKNIDRFIDTDALLKNIVSIINNKDGRDADKLKAIQMILDYRWGKPKQVIDQNNTHTLNNFNLKDLLNFDE